MSNFNTNVGTGKLHCPQCKSNNLTVTTESSVDGAITSSRSNVSTTKVYNTHRNYWVCGDCGTKFRNIQNLEEEIKKNKNSPLVATIICVIATLLCIFFVINIIRKPVGILFFGFFTLALAVVAIVSFCFIFVYKSRLKKMREELEYLKQNCFN